MLPAVSLLLDTGFEIGLAIFLLLAGCAVGWLLARHVIESLAAAEEAFWRAEEAEAEWLQRVQTQYTTASERENHRRLHGAAPTTTEPEAEEGEVMFF